MKFEIRNAIQNLNAATICQNLRLHCASSSVCQTHCAVLFYLHSVLDSIHRTVFLHCTKLVSCIVCWTLSLALCAGLVSSAGCRTHLLHYTPEPKQSHQVPKIRIYSVLKPLQAEQLERLYLLSAVDKMSNCAAG